MGSRFFVFFCFCLAAGVVGYFVGVAVVRRKAVSVEPVELKMESFGSYDVGYERGRRAFLEQQGVDVPVRGRVALYVREEEVDREEENRGYVDGYHRAVEGFYCPGGGTR